MGLGGQSSLQWAPENIDPVAIIVKAYQSVINYYDTSNVYGQSQVKEGKTNLFSETGSRTATPK